MWFAAEAVAAVPVAATATCCSAEAVAEWVLHTVAAVAAIAAVDLAVTLQLGAMVVALRGCHGPVAAEAAKFQEQAPPKVGQP